MKLYALRIFVNEWERACQFYEQTLGLPLKFKDSSMGWAEFDVGGASLALERVAEDDAEGSSLVGRFLGISLEVDDISATYEALQKKGVEFVSPPEKQTWGGTLAHFKDPEGNILTLFDGPNSATGPGP